MKTKTAEHTPKSLGEMAFYGSIRGLLEKTRITMQLHRAARKKQVVSEGDPLLADDPLFASLWEHARASEELIENAMKQWCKEHPVWESFGSHVAGCHPMSLAAVMSRADITRCETVSQFWAHFGFRPGQKRTQGATLDFDPVGRTWCWRLGTNLLMAKGKFYEHYLRRKEYETKRFEGHIVKAKKGEKVPEGAITELHIHSRAMRHMIKLFLSMLWAVWRESEGLSVTVPYSLREGMSHQTLFKPEDYFDK